MKVKLQDVIETLCSDDFELQRSCALRLSAYGIEVQYTPMTDDRDDFLAGICVALQCVTADDSSSELWKEIVLTAGIDAVLNYAANIEPDEWELAGFSKFAQTKLHRNKPRKQAVLNRLGVAPSLDQARAICEQAGYAVVPNKASAQVCMTIMRGLQKGLNNGELYEAIIKMAKEVKP